VRLPRFRLRTLMIAVAVVALLLINMRQVGVLHAGDRTAICNDFCCVDVSLATLGRSMVYAAVAVVLFRQRRYGGALSQREA
jgi:hypothetical protein